MKNTILTLVSIFFITVGFSQVVEIPGTTEEEYNYVTKGYRVQIESGLDMKKGYRFDDLASEIDLDGYKFTIKQLIRESSGQLAALLVKTYSSSSGNTYYLCIPRGNQELVNRYFKELITWDGSISKAYAKVSSIYLSEITSYATELEKTQKK